MRGWRLRPSPVRADSYEPRLSSHRLEIPLNAELDHPRRHYQCRREIRGADPRVLGDDRILVQHVEQVHHGLELARANRDPFFNSKIRLVESLGELRVRWNQVDDD